MVPNFGTATIQIKVLNGDHPPPHCHVRMADGTVTRLAIPSLQILTGPKLSRQAMDLVYEKLEEICAEYDRINPAKH